MTNESLSTSQALLTTSGHPTALIAVDKELDDSLDHVFLKEVHHRIKNNLQIVCSLLRLQGRGLSDNSLRDVLKRSEERIQGMALVYDKLYKSEGHDTVQLDEYLREMATQLVGSVRSRELRPEIEFRLDSVRVSSRLATTIGLLVNEIISNHLRVFAADSCRPLVLILKLGLKSLVIELREPSRSRRHDIALGDMDSQILDALIRQVEGTVSYPMDNGDAVRVECPI
jgi:hypothetical protein